LKQHELIDGARVAFEMNLEDGGYDCPGCAWPDDHHGLAMDSSENGIEHATWELTKKQATPVFFAAHRVSELEAWTDFAQGDVVRLTELLRDDAVTDRYVPISWDDAFALAGRHIRGLSSPNVAAFDTSGRSSHEGAFLCQLWARELGTNNLPDCSNMCQEASGRALQAAIGTGKGTCGLVDRRKADCLIVMGVSADSNAPWLLISLAEAYPRGASIVHVYPLVEAVARRTNVPQDFLRMATFQETPSASVWTAGTSSGFSSKGRSATWYASGPAWCSHTRWRWNPHRAIGRGRSTPRAGSSWSSIPRTYSSGDPAIALASTTDTRRKGRRPRDPGEGLRLPRPPAGRRVRRRLRVSQPGAFLPRTTPFWGGRR
jgi:hypothetical protein